MATFLICHGAWSAGWAWRKMRPLLRAAGHEVFTQFRDRFRGDPGWNYVEMDASHSPNVTAPEDLARVPVGLAG
jgi:hypothetical protein